MPYTQGCYSRGFSTSLQESITGRTPNENPGSRHKETDNVK